MWCCDGCKKSVLEMLQGTRQEASNETIVYKKEIECLKREKSLLEKLLQEIEFSHELLKTQLKRNAEGHISSLDTQATSTKTAVHTLEYSTVAKKQPKKESAILLVNTSDHNDNTNVMDHIKRNINPAELNIRIDGTRKTKSGVAVYCDNASDVNKLENALKTKLGSTYQIHQPKKFNPRMIISNVTLGDELNNDEAITSDIIGLNDLKEIESSQIKIITKLKTRNNDHHIVIEVPPDVRNQFVRTGHVYLSWGRYVVADHLNVIQCRRCFSFGHYEKDCRSTSPVCGKCAVFERDSPAKRYHHGRQEETRAKKSTGTRLVRRISHRLDLRSIQKTTQRRSDVWATSTTETLKGSSSGRWNADPSRTPPDCRC
nr:unnamed protein product [Callosobruchus chinensis]